MSVVGLFDLRCLKARASLPFQKPFFEKQIRKTTTPFESGGGCGSSRIGFKCLNQRN